ncbi:MAG: hypothetical protein M1812_001235 [Candelaria pacifica]|nr:MAG: hypothetical protein M1812_001235 [Candelaria pacifica]
MILGQVSYLDCIAFLCFLAPQLLISVGLWETSLCAIQALPFLVFKLPFQFIKERYFISATKQSPFVRRATAFQDIVIRCVRYAFAQIPAKIGRVFFCKAVALPFLRFRMLRHGYVRSPIYWRNITRDGFKGLWITIDQSIEPDIVVYYCHGGGFSMGSSYFYLEFLLAWVSLLKGAGYHNPAIFALEYTLVPDSVFPTQLQQTLAGYAHVVSIVRQPSKICVGGDSAGATLILSLLLHIADQPDYANRLPGFATIISPWTKLVSPKNRNTPSDYLNAESLHLYARQYVGSKGSLQDPLVSPGMCQDSVRWRRAAPSNGFLFLFGSEEVFAPETWDLISLLHQSNIYVEVREEKGSIHAWPVATLFLSDTIGERRKGLEEIKNIEGIFQTTSEHSPAGALCQSLAFGTHGLNIEPSRTANTDISPPSSSGETTVPNAFLPSIDTIDTIRTHSLHHAHSPLSAGLRLQTDLGSNFTFTSASASKVTTVQSGLSPSVTSAIPVRTPSIKSALSASATAVGSVSPGSAMSSPALASMPDITPLPSPVVSGGSPGPWKRPVPGSASRDVNGLVSPIEPAPTDSIGEPTSAAMAAQKKRRAYQGLMPAAIEAHATNSQVLKENVASHARNRSISEYVPHALQVQKPRHIAVSGEGGPPKATNDLPPSMSHMHREEYLAAQRGLAVARPPTPPPSNRSEAESSDSDNASPIPSGDVKRARSSKTSHCECFEAQTIRGTQKRRWRAVRQLGQGTFSKVMLATSEGLSEDRVRGIGEVDYIEMAEELLDPKKLVAVKVVEHGPAGGADEQRVESSLKRELEILKSIRHPSLVHLRAWSIESTRALLVLSYCSGGDLFDVASQKHQLLNPSLIRRMFAELVAAVRYLHADYIVHRDIKLENVLLNLPTSSLTSITDWQTYPHPIVTLTDLGLSRRIPAPPDSSLLTTRCGSEDYAAPELLMGQQYDGRATDAWALGVLLYAIMEGRLPFDPLPITGNAADAARKMRSRTAHRVARCEWSWVKYADEEGEALSQDGFGDLWGAKEVVEGLLKRARTRLSLDAVKETEWVSGGISVDGELKRKEEDDHDEEEED